jgi:hypothetical protein
MGSFLNEQNLLERILPNVCLSIANEDLDILCKVLRYMSEDLIALFDCGGFLRYIPADSIRSFR